MWKLWSICVWCERQTAKHRTKLLSKVAYSVKQCEVKYLLIELKDFSASQNVSWIVRMWVCTCKKRYTREEKKCEMPRTNKQAKSVSIFSKRCKKMRIFCPFCVNAWMWFFSSSSPSSLSCADFFFNFSLKRWEQKKRRMSKKWLIEWILKGVGWMQRIYNKHRCMRLCIQPM